MLAGALENACHLFRAQTGGFWILHDSGSALVLAGPGFGLSADASGLPRLPLARGGPAVTAFVSGQSSVSDRIEGPLRELAGDDSWRGADASVLTLPLTAKGTVVAVLQAVQAYPGDFTESDLRVGETVAPQLALVVRSAVSLSAARRQQMELQRMVQVHHVLAEMVVNGRDVADLVVKLSELLGHPVVFAERGGRVVGSPHECAHGRGKDAVLRSLDELERKAPASLAPAIVQEDVDKWAIAVPITVADELMGCVGVLARTDDLGAVEVRSLQQASLVLALNLAREREVLQVQHRLQSNLVEHLLLTDDEAESIHLLRRLGLEPGTSFRIAQLLLSPIESKLRFSNRFHTQQVRLHRFLMTMLENDWPGTIAVIQGENVLLVLPMTDDADISGLRRRLQPVFDRLRGLAAGGPVQPEFIGVGGVATTMAGAKRSFADAAGIVAARTLLGQRRLVFLEEMGIFRLLNSGATATDVDAFVESSLGPVVRKDGKTGSDWLHFLRVLADCNFSVKLAARRLGVHLSTARYRAARIEQLLGVSLASADARFNLQLALRMLDQRDALGSGRHSA